tara:strand:+ start:2677 stop:2883 length:207 start_codon:yes stop_codon:yes gene_type:complete
MAVTIAAIETAICEVQENGQSVEMDGVTYDAANLRTLFDMRTKLQSEVDRTSGARPLMRGVNLGGAAY